MEKVYICGPLTRKRAVRVHLEPIIKQYLDYVTEGEFSRSNPDFGRGPERNEASLFDNQRGRREGTGTSQQGESTNQQRQKNKAVLPGNGRVPKRELN